MASNVSSLTSVSVSTAVYDDTAVQIARDFLQGYSGEYFFFQYSPTTYVLLYDFDNAVKLPTSFSCNSASVFEINVSTGLPLVNTVYSINGTLVGTEEQVLSATAQNSKYTNLYKSYSYAYDSPISITLNDYVSYSSYPGSPHLIQGVENYAFFAVCLFVGFCIFRLCDRLFRRIY